MFDFDEFDPVSEKLQTSCWRKFLTCARVDFPC